MSNEIWVGPTETHRTLDAALAASLAGDTIYVRAGVYTVGDTTLQHALTIVGVGGEVILTSARTLGRERGLLTTQSDLTVENITFRGAWSAEGSAAGIVVEGGDLIVRNSKFEQNETGILARDGATGSILIENSRFAGNGWGDATTAAVVAGRGTESLTVADSYFLENAAGHHILSRAAATVVERSILDDGSAGSLGSSIELPDGGRVVIEDNVIRKGASGANQVGVEYGANADLAHDGSSLSVSSNHFSDASGTGRGVVNGLAGTVADISYNAFHGLATVSEGAAQVSDNVVEALPASESAAPGGSGGSTGSAFGSAGASSGGGVSAFSSEAGSSVSSLSVGNAGGAAKPAGTTQMNHTFARGEMVADAPLQVLLNGVLTPVTVVVQSTHDDGSIKVATLSFDTPALAAGAAVSATLVRGSLTPSEQAPATGGGTVEDPGSSTGDGSAGGDTGSDTGTNTGGGDAGDGGDGATGDAGSGDTGAGGDAGSGDSGSGGDSGAGTGGGSGDPNDGAGPGTPPGDGDVNIVDVTMVNAGTAARPAGFWTFGQVFKQGDLADGDELYATINGQKVALQVDVKNTWDDGSVKHAIVTVKTPALAAGGSATIELMRDTTPDARGGALTVNQMLAGNLDLKLELSNLNGSTVTLDAKTVLAQAIANGTVKTWLAGENAIEVAVRAKINDQLEAEFDIRFHADGTYTTDVIVRNDWAFTAGVVKTNYNVAIKDSNVIVFSQDNVSQNQYSTWHQTISSSTSLNAMYAQVDAVYLQATGAIPSYDFSFSPTETRLAGTYAGLQTSDQSLMGNAGITRSIGMTGERDDIGPLPAWTVDYLRSGDIRAAENMYAKADAAGSVPWHFRDERSGETVNLDDFSDRQLWIDGRASTNSAYTSIKFTANAGSTGWALDAAHQPSLTYVPYLLTGSQYYLSETFAEASWVIGAVNWRGDQKSLVAQNEQMRGQAWGLRDLANAAFAAPDGSEMQSYFLGLVNRNLDWYVSQYIDNGIQAKYGELEGFFFLRAGSHSGYMAPWQQDFMTIVLGTLAEQGYTQAADLLNWSANFTAGRFLHAADGFNPYAGFGYQLSVEDRMTKSPFTSWSEAYQASKQYLYNGVDLSAPPTDAYASSGIGYVATARASTATLARLGNLDGMEAYGFTVESSPSLSTAFLSAGKYALAFKLGPDGEDVALSDHVTGTSASDIINGSARADVLVGGKGNDTIGGGEGGDALYGSDGNDELNGGAGNDALFGGAGADTLVGGAGDDTLRGGDGEDVFMFNTADFGHDLIDDFQLGADVILFSKSALPSGINTVADVLATVYADAVGNAVIQLGHDRIVLNNISPTAIMENDILIQ